MPTEAGLSYMSVPPADQLAWRTQEKRRRSAWRSHGMPDGESCCQL